MGLAHPPPAPYPALGPAFFDRDAQAVACDLLGKRIVHAVEGQPAWAQIVETEAYYRAEKASHASLGNTPSRRALFMPPGTIYMYYARGGDSFNVSCAGAGNAVLIKAARVPLEDPHAATMIAAMMAAMARRCPLPSGRARLPERLCAGQTLLCKALGLRVPDWNEVLLGKAPLSLQDLGTRPRRIARTTRLGIPPGRDAQLPYRFVDADHAGSATRNPLRRGQVEGRDYTLLSPPQGPQPVDWAALLAGLPGCPQS